MLSGHVVEQLTCNYQYANNIANKLKYTDNC